VSFYSTFIDIHPVKVICIETEMFHNFYICSKIKKI